VGTGSGYQAAVLSRLVSRVFSIELVEPLALSAAATLQRLGYSNVTVRSGDGYHGWPEEAPFDIILVTAAPEDVPPALLAQLRPGGRLVIPVGPIWDVQDLKMIEKDQAGRITTRSVIPVRFVPLVKKRAG
jgi:protein-L-isoaspartate(D-aspartate) O-methyltransferase